ncbi:MAG: iron-sulfur cluster assembly protein [Chloroflexota bacterium]|nr:iron-sulfur cluster assembly protein [Chloroflexota bacterium]
MKERAPSSFQEEVVARLQEVIDPETNVDVMRMRLIENLTVDHDGKVSYTFRPSSPLCPLAVSLATQVKQAIAEVPGVTGQEILIEGYIAAEELTKLINKEN